MKRKTIILSAIAYLTLIAVILVIGLTIKRTQLLSDKESASVSSSMPLTAGNVGLTATRTKAQTESSPQIPLVDATSGTASPMLGDEQTGYPDNESTQLVTPITPSPTPSTQVQSGGGARSRTPTRTTQPTETVQPTKTPTKTATQVPSKTPTRTPTPQTGWEGEWTVWHGPPNGPFLEGKMQVTVTDNLVSAVASIGSETYNLNGEIFGQGLQVSGRYSNQGSEGWFLWQLTSNTQFGGTLDNKEAFCAARQDETQPETCGIYSPY